MTERVGWVERSDTHPLQFAMVMGFAKGSTHPTGYARFLHVIASEAKQSILSLRGGMDCFASLAMTSLQFQI